MCFNSYMSFKIEKTMMEIQPRIENLNEKKLIGKRLEMSLANNKTGVLWASFMPHRKSILNAISDDVISMQVHPSGYFSDFKPTTPFEKWATVEVSDFAEVPMGMEKFILPGGLYAVFHYKGSSSDPSIFQYIFGTWLPGSDYVLDARPHFEVLGEKYKNNDPSSEEEIWIPIKPKKG
jgi:AraC family transcriptional regulator